MKRLFDCADHYIQARDWKMLAGLKFCLCAIGVLLGLAVVMALAAIGAVVLERLSKDSEKKFRLAQILASAALVIGMFNAFM